MNAVTSKDGTKIAYYTSGSGPAVVVVPGALSIAKDFTAFAKALANNFTVHVIERRGRGESGPQGDNYSIERECEDVAAVLAATKATSVVGHSFGGLISMEVARRNSSIKQLAVYEPGVSIDNTVPIDWADDYEQKLRENKPVEAFILFIKAMNPASRRTPNWMLKLILPRAMGEESFRKTIKLLPESLREHREAARLNNSYENYRTIQANTLFMRGTKGQMGGEMVAERLSKTIPTLHIKIFPGLDHFGINEKAPEEVAKAINEFLKQNK
jgi:pimeloyl-ACP methyl ester carboxylesterase